MWLLRYRTETAAVDRALRIVVLVWTGAWIPLMAFLELDSEDPTSPITVTMLAALMVGWVVVVAARLPVNGWCVAALAGTALVQATLTEPVGLWAESSLLITWTNLAALCCGFTIAGARGRFVRKWPTPDLSHICRYCRSWGDS